jgi:hypothetical protein
LARTKILVGKRLKQRIEYAASRLAYYPSASSWCRAVALQAVQAQRAGRRLPQPLTDLEPLNQELFIYDLSPEEKRLIEQAASEAVGEAGVSDWLRRCFEAELERLEVAGTAEPAAPHPLPLRHPA